MADRAVKGPYRALVGVDLKRMRSHLGRGIMLTLAFMALSIVAGYGGLEDVAVVLVGTSFYYFLWPAMAAALDRREGGLEFLASLPVSPSAVAWARLTGVAVALLPCALYLTVAFVLALAPALGVEPAVGSTLAVFLLSWLLTAGLSALLAGVLMRWGVDVLNQWPAKLTILGAGALFLFGDRYTDAVGVFVADLVGRAGWIWTLAGFIVVVSVVFLSLGHVLIATGLVRFTPERGRLTA